MKGDSMKHIGLTIALLILAGTAGAADRSAFSPEAQKLIPAEKIVNLTLSDGQTARGIVLSETEKDVTFRLQKGTMNYQMTYPRTDIKKMEPISPCVHLADGLKNFAYETEREYTEANCTLVIGLCDEFLKMCAGSPEADAVRQQRDSFAAEMQHMKDGLKKINGRWLPPVSAAIENFNDLTKKMQALEDRYGRNLGATSYRADKPDQKMAKQYYDRFSSERRNVARTLPQQVISRIPSLVAAKSFDEAVDEVSAFLKFWILEVLESEAGGSGQRADIQSVIEGMDFGYITRLQTNIMHAYIQDPASQPAPDGVTEEGMVYIPGGYFLMGRADATYANDTFPLHIVFVSPFLLDMYETDNAGYREFADHVKNTGDSSMAHPDAPPLKDHSAEGWKDRNLSGDRKPVIGIDWFDAYAYAKYKDKRLPTEAEWEFAARGRDGRIFSWGDEPPKTRILSTPFGRDYVAGEIDRLSRPAQRPGTERKGLMGRKPEEQAVQRTTLPAGTWDVDKGLPQEAIDSGYFDENKDILSPFGVFHMTGNAAEWTQDWYDPHYYRTSPTSNPPGPDKGSSRVFRGGSYLSASVNELETTWRGFYPPNMRGRQGMSSNGKPMIGVRCAKSIPGVDAGL